MKDVQQKTRASFYLALSGLLTYEGETVPVIDDTATLEDNVDMYVLLSSQTAVDVSNFTKYQHECTMTLDIVHKTNYAVARDGVDYVAQQIFNIISPNVTTNGIATDVDVQFVNVKKQSDNYLTMELSSGAIVRRIIVFSVLVHEK